MEGTKLKLIPVEQCLKMIVNAGGGEDYFCSFCGAKVTELTKGQVLLRDSAGATELSSYINNKAGEHFRTHQEQAKKARDN